MQVSRILIEDFRPFFGENAIDISPSSSANVILIGGKNGFGKTSMLLAMVWALYGEELANVDENFRTEFGSNKYANFLEESLNWTAKKYERKSFSVTIEFRDIQLGSNELISLRLKRSYDVSQYEETTELLNVDNGKIISSNLEAVRKFVNEFIIPVEAAKFVFFDAEKISEIANLGIKAEGRYFNDALAKILGLEQYSQLVETLEDYIKEEKKKGLHGDIKSQITNRENQIRTKKIEIDDIDENQLLLQKENEDYERQRNELDELVNHKVSHTNQGIDLVELKKGLTQNKIAIDSYGAQLNEMVELVPFAMLLAEIENIAEHLETQNESLKSKELHRATKEKMESVFTDLMFNAPFPLDKKPEYQIQKFYQDKFTRLISDAFNYVDSDVDFEFDMTRSDFKLIIDCISIVQGSALNKFQEINENLQTKAQESKELRKKIRRIEAGHEDEEFLKWKAQRNDLQELINKNLQTIGAHKSDLSRLRGDIDSLGQELKTLYGKAKNKAESQEKINHVQGYIDVINKFIESQKVEHKSNLETSILANLKTIMHKLKGGAFIEKVEVTILPNNGGMMVKLLNSEREEIPKDKLSAGEKQIYISSLIKALFQESIQPLPIFIDTPLGRLDEEHRNSIAKNYYPTLSDQVVIFSTDSEITPSRLESMKGNVAKTFTLEHQDKQTTIKGGYFEKN
jgi:DNA sulfur modification protein DndD